jgi:Ca-activated chloride channel homolog
MLLLAFTGAAAQADTWNDLWATREQQAQQLLESKKAAEAAPLFSDPRRRAYAELQAGQYAKAAEHLAPFKDADSQYNRGNALAHAGKLQDALAAYDAALAQSPDNRDVKRNRDLVAQALKQQSQQGQQQGGGNSQSDKQGSPEQQANRDQAGNPSQAANGGQPNKDGQSGNQSQPGDQGQQGDRGQQGNPSQAAANQAHDGDGQSQSQPQPEKQAQAANQQQAGSQSQSAANQAQAGDRAPQPGSSATQGNRPADDLSDLTANKSQGPQTNGAGSAQAQPQAPPQTAAQAQSQPAQPQTSTQAQASAKAPTPTEARALAEAGQRGASGADPISAQRALAGANAAPQLPRSEQALALDQWLRGIPEDSGELLRRKFMIEHMMKQQGNEP